MDDRIHIKGCKCVECELRRAADRLNAATAEKGSFDEQRADVIGQNGNDGEHYELVDTGVEPHRVVGEAEHTGLSVDYYRVLITNPTTDGVKPYIAECNDIIEALGMTYAEGNVFKATWRRCAARTLGKHKLGNNALYDAEKGFFFSDRILKIEKQGAKK